MFFYDLQDYFHVRMIIDSAVIVAGYPAVVVLYLVLLFVTGKIIITHIKGLADLIQQCKPHCFGRTVFYITEFAL